METTITRSLELSIQSLARPGCGRAGAPPGRSWSAPGRSVWRWRSIWRSAACRSLLLDDDDKLSIGSRAICFAKRTLEIFDRLGCRRAHGRQGRVAGRSARSSSRTSWSTGSTCCPKRATQRPAFINLQQYYVEGYLVERAATLPNLDLRWKNKVVGLTQHADHVEADGRDARRTVPADARLAGRLRRRAQSPVRSMLGLESKGQVFRDRFLIADVKMKARLPDRALVLVRSAVPPRPVACCCTGSPTTSGASTSSSAGTPIRTRRRSPSGSSRASRRCSADGRREFELEWVSVYTFACLRMEQLPPRPRDLRRRRRARRVAVRRARRQQRRAGCRQPGLEARSSCCEGRAPDALLDSYGDEREYAADENILNSTRATDFITPKSEISRVFRDAVLELAEGRIRSRAGWSTAAGCRCRPCCADSPLNTPDADAFAGAMVPGAPSADAPVRVHGDDGWLLRHVGGGLHRRLLRGSWCGTWPKHWPPWRKAGWACKPVVVVQPGDERHQLSRDRCLEDSEGLLATRYDARPGTFYLLRPDQHVCARWRSFDATQVRSAVARATGNP